MWPYFVLLLIICVCAFIDNGARDKLTQRRIKKTSIRKFAHILLAVFSGFRYKVGVDYDNYISTFNWDIGYSVNEPGFEFLINFLTKIGATPQMMFFIMAVVTQYFVYQTFKKSNKGFWLATIVYYCFSTFYIASFNGSRQYVAIAIAIWALKFVYERKYIQYFTSVIIAALCFHFTVLIFIPVYFYLLQDYSRKSIIIQIVAVIFGARFLNIIVSYTPYLVYLERERDMPINDTVYLFTIVSFTLAFLSHKYKLLKNDRVFINMNLLCLFSLILVLVQTSGMMIQMLLRINSYFLFAYLCILPKVVYSIRPQIRKIVQTLLIIAAFAYLVKTIVFGGVHYSLVPYQMNFELFKI